MVACMELERNSEFLVLKFSLKFILDSGQLFVLAKLDRQPVLY